MDIVDGDYTAIDNCTILREDIDTAEDIFWTNLGSLKRKQTRSKTKNFRTRTTPTLPSILSRYKNIILEGDIMKVNKVPFLTTVS